MSIKNRYKTVQKRIAVCAQKSKTKHTIDLLAVSKKQDISKIQDLYQMGQKKFGESYISEALLKISHCNELGQNDIQWHFIGPLQSNKSKYVAGHFSWVQSVDSHKLLRRLNDQRSSSQPKLNVLLQLKVGNEETKRGLDCDELLALTACHDEFERLQIRGLMCLPPLRNNYLHQLEQFSICKKTYELMQKIIPVDTLSIGMSSDLEAAIESGSTMVRVGTDLFGPR